MAHDGVVRGCAKSGVAGHWAALRRFGCDALLFLETEEVLVGRTRRRRQSEPRRWSSRDF